MKTGITNAAQIQNNTIINTTRIVKGYAFDDATLVPITIKNPFSFGYNKGFIKELLNLEMYNNSFIPLNEAANEEISFINPSIEITSKLFARVTCYYNHIDSSQYFYVPPPSDLDLKINEVAINVRELSSDSGLTVMTGIHGFDTIFKLNETYTFTCNSKYTLDITQITINDEFISKYWSFGSTNFQSDKLRFSINIKNA